MGRLDSDILKLEHIHLDAMRLVTGATGRSNSINVDEEYDGCTVSDRIKHATLAMLFKVVRDMAQEYLINIFLDLNGPRNYIILNNTNLRVPYYGLET